MQCLLCGSPCAAVPLFTVHDRLHPGSPAYAVHECPSCRSIMVHPAPDEGTVAALYPPHYNFKVVDRGKGLSGALRRLEWNLFYRKIYERNCRLIRQVTGKGEARLLDVGCGSGLRLSVMREKGFAVEGNDTSSECVRYIREHLGIAARLGRIEELDWKGRRYDAVTMFALFEHLCDPAKTIRAVRDLLSDDGALIVQVPVVDSLQFALLGKRAAMIADMPRHVFIPSRSGLQAFMERNGFSLELLRPVSVLESATLFALGLVPSAATPRAYTFPAFRALCRRAAGWALTLAAGIPVGLLERARGIGAETIFIFRKKA